MRLKIPENHQRSLIWKILDKAVHGQTLPEPFDLLGDRLSFDIEVNANVDPPEGVHELSHFFGPTEVEGPITEISVGHLVT